MKTITPTTFREALKKLLPGYKWTVERLRYPDQKIWNAEGKQSSGYNRTSTINVTLETDKPKYKAKYYDFGLRGPSIESSDGPTLAQCIRNLQASCEHNASKYRAAAECINAARKKKP